MAEISRLLQLVTGFQRGVDLSTNTLVVGDIKIGGAGGSLLTQTILDRLISLQNGSTLTAGTFHKHHATDILYDRVDGSKVDIQAASDEVEAALTDLDDRKISRAGLVAFTADQPMGTFKLTGLGAGTAAGHSVRYEQAILVSGANAFAADQSHGGFKITNLADPTAAQDGATKFYVDSALDGRKWKQSVLVATTANITLSGEQTIDGVLTSASRVLVKNQTAPAENGIYVSAAGAWARSSDADTAGELTGVAVFVEQGTVNSDSQWAQTADSITLGTTAITWVLTSVSALAGGDMIVVTGGSIAVDLASDAGLESSNAGNAAGQLRVKLDGATLARSSSGLKVSDAGITGTQLAASVAGAGLTGGAGSALAVGAGNGISVAADSVAVAADATGGANLAKAINVSANGVAVKVDDSTIEGDTGTGQLRVKDSGISTAKIAANAVDDTKVRLRNNQYLRARNAADSADVDILKVNASDIIEFASFPRKSGTPTNADELVNKSYVDAAAASASTVSESVVVGESMAANTTFLVRRALTGETIGRVYKADKATGGGDKFMVVGSVTVGGTGLTAGDAATMYTFGTTTQGSSDTAFTTGQAGMPIYLGSAGAWLVGQSNAPTTALDAVVIVGIVKTTTTWDVRSVMVQGVN